MTSFNAGDRVSAAGFGPGTVTHPDPGTGFVSVVFDADGRICKVNCLVRLPNEQTHRWSIGDIVMHDGRDRLVRGFDARRRTLVLDGVDGDVPFSEVRLRCGDALREAAAVADLQTSTATADTVNSTDRRAWWDCMVQIAQQADAAPRGTTERQVLDANLAGAVRCWCAVTGQDVIQVRDVLRESARAYPLHATQVGGRS